MLWSEIVGNRGESHLIAIELTKPRCTQRTRFCHMILPHDAHSAVPPLRRFVVQLARQRGYFFWLYVAYCGCEGLLAAMALLYFPRKDRLLLWSPHEEGYLVRPAPD